jgi:hypothetical protein
MDQVLVTSNSASVLWRSAAAARGAKAGHCGTTRATAFGLACRGANRGPLVELDGLRHQFRYRSQALYQ